MVSLGTAKTTLSALLKLNPSSVTLPLLGVLHVASSTVSSISCLPESYGSFYLLGIDVCETNPMSRGEGSFLLLKGAHLPSV